MPQYISPAYIATVRFEVHLAMSVSAIVTIQGVEVDVGGGEGPLHVLLLAVDVDFDGAQVVAQIFAAPLKRDCAQALRDLSTADNRPFLDRIVMVARAS